MTNPHECPVCREDFGNPGALAAHLSLTKDAAHHAHRVGSHLLPAPGSTGGSNPPAGSPPNPPDLGTRFQFGSGTQNPPVPPVGEPTRPDSVSDPSRPAEPKPEPEIVTFLPPPQVGPLMPEPSPTQPDAGNTPTRPDGAKPPSVEVPLEPFIAAGVAALTNGLILRAPEDGKLSAQEALETKFPKAAEACLEFYFPTVAWDHPLVALFVSGSALAGVIASKKAPKKKAQREAEPAQPEPEAHPTQAPEPPAQPASRTDGTGDAYWDAILRQAQGGPRRGDDDD